MHEFGVLMEIVKSVEGFAVGKDVGKIEELVLQIGNRSSMIPEYLEKLYPGAIEGSILKDSKLIIEVTEGRDFNIKEIHCR